MKNESRGNDHSKRSKKIKTIKLTVEVPVDAIDSMLVSAVESGGIGYWANVRYADPDKSYRGMIVTETNGKKRSAIIDRAAIKRGLAIMAKDHRDSFDDILERADKNTADVFVQCIVLGDVVYG
jgi:hypothetical protein